MSLYQLARDGETDELLNHLWESESPAVRQRAAELLGELGVEDDDELVRGVVEAARTDDDSDVRAAAIDALDDIGPAAIDRLLVELTGVDTDEAPDWVRAERFAKALRADEPELRMAAASALGQLGEPKVTPALVDALDDSDPRVRVRVVAACGRLGDRRAVGPLADLLDGSRGETKRAIADALAEIGDDRALDALQRLLDDDNETIRWIAVSALGNATGLRPVRKLAAALTDESDTVRRAAVFSFIQLLSNAPSKQSHGVREAVVSNLQSAGDETVIDPLVEILTESTQRPQRRNAAWLLGRVTGSERSASVADPLIEALGDDDATVAQFAATSLSTVGGEAVEERLLDIVADPEVVADVQAKAVFVLGRVGGERARERLEALTHDSDDEEVRRRAFAALSKLGGYA